MARKKADSPPFTGRVMGIDPGTQNFAWAIMGPDGFEDHDVEEGIRKDVGALPDFTIRLWRVLNKFKPDAVVIERYHPRGRGPSFVGHTERVNLSIGAVCCMCMPLRIPFALVEASTHKTWAKRVLGAMKKKDKISTSTVALYDQFPTEHEKDAANLAHYGRLKTFAGTEP